MSHSHPNTILPPFTLEAHNTYQDLITNPTNRHLFRLSPAFGRGALRSGGFYGQSTQSQNDGHFTGSIDQLAHPASAHITQWKDGTAPLRSPFISASFSIAYALFEAHRWNTHHKCTDTQISIIDTAQLTSDAWLATELVGACAAHTAFNFACWAEEVLVYQHIPFGAVVATAPLPAFLDALPRWCDDIITQIQLGDLRSTEEVARTLASAAADPANNTQAAEDALQLLAVTQSVRLLRYTLPASMLTFDAHTHAAAVDAIARLALVFIWWPKWITGVDPVAYSLDLRPGVLRVPLPA
ncbi:hypothetical protein B0H17DRAFT_1328363 [Mycena rosella]|uniref:DUF7587 domain-containing protein n=1 Tax=Mycena rosella TaxID=1033263 RepID=A0AAD7DST5_MYCRO|nr:hypothetical protein B0H17DRAFT_1328363 [Mycena rosella]